MHTVYFVVTHRGKASYHPLSALVNSSRKETRDAVALWLWDVTVSPVSNISRHG